MIFMRWHIDPIEHYGKPSFGEIYYCDHPVYNRGTLYLNEKIGLVVIQQRCKSKLTYWTEVDPWLCDEIFKHPGFIEYFKKRAGACKDGLYPTVTVRQIMWALKMKPLRKERWETVFDRKDI